MRDDTAGERLVVVAGCHSLKAKSERAVDLTAGVTDELIQTFRDVGRARSWRCPARSRIGSAHHTASSMSRGRERLREWSSTIESELISKT